jgi:2-iminobutanoate/2-iminopropanoate deaminase
MNIEILSTREAPESKGPYAQATRVGQLVFCSGQGGFDPVTGALVDGGIRPQTLQVLRNIEAILASVECDRRSVAKVTVFLHSWSDFAEMNEVFADFFGEHHPARSTVCGERWPVGSLVAMEAIAIVD